MKKIYVKFKYKGTCTTFQKCGHKARSRWHKEGATRIQKCHYCNNIRHVNKYCHKITKEEKSKTNKSKVNITKKYTYCKNTNHKEKCCYKNKKSQK